VLHVIVAQSDVAPVLSIQLVGLQRGASEIDGGAIDREHALDFAMQHQDLVSLRSLRPEGRTGGTNQRLVGHREHPKVELRERDRARALVHDLHVERLEELEDRPGLL